MSMELRGTTICAVRKNGHTSIAGDGQVTMGQSVIFKSHAHKVRRLYGGQVVIGFAGAVADAFTLCDKFEEKLTQCGGNLERAAVALAQMWRSDSRNASARNADDRGGQGYAAGRQRHGRGHRPGRGRGRDWLRRQLCAGSGARAGAEHRPLRARALQEKRCTSRRAFACSPTTT